ncbi:hypothetical protein CASFOL_035829 [Castilleja foliolosa]|uniref:Protein phosphatase n=1 Tax=Castilleja foliolosa TaxID=1961234 RepID=A0ABD3BUG8_9LAMI
MADFCCRFLNFRSLASNHEFVHLFSPSKHSSSSSPSALVHSRNSTIGRIKRNPLHITKQFSSDLDVISTHEHSDGSLLFRFGDPSEVAKNVKIEEPKPDEEMKTEGEDGDKVKKVFNSDHEKEVIINKKDADITGSGPADHTSSILVKLHVEDAEECTSEANKDLNPDMENNITTTLELSENHEMRIEIVEDVGECLEGDVAIEESGGENDLTEENDGTESLKVLNTDENVQSGEVLGAISVDELIESKSTEAFTQSEELLMTNFVLSSGAALLAHPSKVLTGGEDAYFFTGQTWLGVADGVGQWSLEGANPGVYAQELVKNCERLVAGSNGKSVNNALELLNLSVAETHSPGSSTVLIAQFDGQALNVANVGDTGFIVLRKGAVYKRSSPMRHAFHFPLRIGRGDDPPSLAELYRVELEDDDVIITATDGLLDNLYDQEISSIVMKSLADDKRLEEIAALLATKAQEIGLSESARSPFADEAQAAGFAKYNGGKLDGVAVIVSLVQKAIKH